MPGTEILTLQAPPPHSELSEHNSNEENPVSEEHNRLRLLLLTPEPLELFILLQVSGILLTEPHSLLPKMDPSLRKGLWLIMPTMLNSTF